MPGLPDLLGALRSAPVIYGTMTWLVISWIIAVAFPSSEDILGLAVGRALLRPWSFLTAGLVEGSLLWLVPTVGTLAVAAQTIEPAHGARGTAELFLSATLGATGFLFLSASLGYALASYLDDDGSGKTTATWLLAPRSGSQAVVSACLVALKQLAPGAQAPVLGGRLHVRVGDLASWHVALWLALAATAPAGERAPARLTLALGGTIAAWLHLRHVAQPDEVGEVSEEMRLASFFPARLGPSVDAAGRAVGGISGRVATGPFGRVVRRAAGRLTGSLSPVRGAARGVSPHSPGLALKTTLSADAPELPEAARRRERGTRALAERLEVAAGNLGSALPSRVEGVV